MTTTGVRLVNQKHTEQQKSATFSLLNVSNQEGFISVPPLLRSNLPTGKKYWAISQSDTPRNMEQLTAQLRLEGKSQAGRTVDVRR